VQRFLARVVRRVFVQTAPPPVVAPAYRWAQLDRGGTELLASTRRGLEVWRSRRAHWSRLQTVDGAGEPEQIALGDYDNSGTLDVLVTGRRGVRLLANRGGRLHPVPS